MSKSYNTGVGFSKKPTVVGGQEGPLGDVEISES